MERQAFKSYCGKCIAEQGVYMDTETLHIFKDNHFGGNDDWVIFTYTMSK